MVEGIEKIGMDIHIKLLAERMATAYTSLQLGLSMDHTYKRYVKPSKTIGKYWIELAKRVDKELKG